MTRFKPYREDKYILSKCNIAEIQKNLSGFCTPDSHGQNGCYEILSLYFDTPDYKFFKDKLEGEFDKIKLRLRLYRNSLKNFWHNPCLEIKKRSGLWVSKEKINLSSSAAERALQNMSYTDLKDILCSEVKNKSLLPRLLRQHLILTVAVYYRRDAFEATQIPGLRFTFDSNLTALQPSIKLLSQNQPLTELSLLQKFPTIFEAKYYSGMPASILSKLEKLGISCQSFSKYASSLFWLSNFNQGRFSISGQHAKDFRDIFLTL
jgi:hypothetical protein